MGRLSVGLVAALVALNVIGGGILIRWLVKQVQALEGTVRTQGQTIGAQGEALKAADQTFRMLNELLKALDLEQWAKRFESHRKLVEAEGEAKLEAARRELRDELEAAQSRGQQTMDVFRKSLDSYMGLAIASLAYAPRSERAGLIDRSELPDGVTQTLKDWAALAPETPAERALGVLASLAEEVVRRVPPENLGSPGVFDKTPPIRVPGTVKGQSP